MRVAGVPQTTNRQRTRTSKVLRMLAATGLAVGLSVAGTGAATAQEAGPVTMTTPYPTVAVQPGSTISFDLTVEAPSPQQVGVEVVGAPEGWQTTLRGGGYVIGAVTAGPDEDAADFEVEVRIPLDAKAGTYPLRVRANGPSGTSEVTLQLVVQEEVNAGINITADFPSLRGAPNSTFTYTLTVENNTPAEQTFTFDTSGPQGWEVTASPTAQSQANTVTVEAGDTENVRVEAKAPESTEEGTYPIQVTVASASGARGSIELSAEVSGSPRLELATADSRLNASGEANSTTRIPLIVANSGSAALENVNLAGTAPDGWEVSFEPSSIELVRPNDTAQAVAVIKPKAGAVAGDYSLTLRASAGSESQRLELRYSVEGSRALGIAGVALIVAAVGVLGGVFWRFGRR